MFNLITIAAALLVGLQGSTLLVRAQIVGLRHPPELIRRPPPIASQVDAASKFVAKPGTIVAHFDKNHDISKLSYVLQDGRLATLYQQRHQQSRSDPVQVPPPAAGAQASQAVAAAQAQAGRAIDPEQSIDILDDKMRQVSRLIGGDHVTVALPEANSQRSAGDSLARQATAAAAAASSNQQAISDDEKMDVLATIAVDAADAKLRKAGVFMDKLKDKLALKLRDMPRILESKLRAKSSVGQVVLDRLGGRGQTLVVDGSGQLPTGAQVVGSNSQSVPQFVSVPEPLVEAPGESTLQSRQDLVATSAQ